MDKINMSLLTLLESQNKDLRNSLCEWQEKVRQNQVVIGAKDRRIAELEHLCVEQNDLIVDYMRICNPHRGSDFNDFLKEDCGMSDGEINSSPNV
jgi:hypothetical protein